ncbi:cob(I)yrinic acid a,c-diamide adenosyltransferase [Bacillus fonticola]|uniref:cob(I)yrinic acid a,c-diamide adenosyltransferase n=1 Tax=Bacillus fonticola TaxID=2728853 RepID=UPI00147548CD|nr:cob(I)yrinic acid a,c-diamide adenosyltransferase [Bacillus fonticola]
MSIYTKTGDKGKTSLIGGRVDKDHRLVESYGTLDELNSFVGLTISEITEFKHLELQDIILELKEIQHALFDCGADLANISTRKEVNFGVELINFLETRIDTYTEETPQLKRFILPGGCKASSYLHVARTIARRAERLLVRVNRMNEDVDYSIEMAFLNRLSDYFFALARYVNFLLDFNDIEYIRNANVKSFKGGKK